MQIDWIRYMCLDTKMILSKIKPNYQVGKKPDILMDRAKNIAYQGVKGRGFQDTGLNVIDIFKELK